MRICDGLPTLDEVIAVTALIQALVVWLGDKYDEGMYMPLHRHWIVRENKWRAARWSTEAEIIVDEDGNLERLDESLGALVEEVTPVAKRLGGDTELQGVGAMLETGLSYRRQRRIYEETGDYTTVMKALVREFRQNAPVLA